MIPPRKQKPSLAPHIALVIVSALAGVVGVKSFDTPATANQQKPLLGVTQPVELVRVVDGDTVDVRPVQTIRVRLIGAWAPEARTPEGARATAALERLLTDKRLVLSVPHPEDGELRRTLSLGRVLGRLYADGEDVGAALVREGFAAEVKH